MMNTIATSAINIFALVILSRLVVSNSIIIRQRKKPFCIGIIITVIVILAEVGTIVAGGGGAEGRYLNITSNVLGFIFTPFIPLVLLAIFDVRVLKSHVYLFLPALINGIVAGVSPFFGFIFSIDADNRYTRGPFFLLFVTVYKLHILFLVFFTLSKTDQLHSIYWRIFGLSMFVVIGTCVQLIFPTVYTTWHSVTLTLFLYYLILSEHDGKLDPLTGLDNRSAFEKDIRNIRHKKRCTVIAMDVNDFKLVNDTYGHEYGDAVLTKVAATIRASFDRYCGCYRVGGDEFCVLCKGTDPEKLHLQLEKMTRLLDEERLLDSTLPTVAYGLATSQTKDPDMQAMLKAADAEMYECKHKQKSFSKH